MIRVLFIDDDISLQKIFKMILDRDFTVISAYTGKDGIARLEESKPDIVLLDIGLPDIDGITVLKRIKALSAAPPVIMVSAVQEIKMVVDAIKNGACDYMIKSGAADYGMLKGMIRQAVAGAAAVIPDRQAFSVMEAIVGESKAMQTVKERIMFFAPSDSAILIEGESGTGKEIVAQVLHKLSRRCQHPFVPVNCGAIPINLVETSLFGSEKGAYTDAVSAPGYFEKAGQGTIFLDEIGEMAPDAQVKLLRVLETREFERVGGSVRIQSNIRVIAATNKTLKAEIEKNKFRADLYYRLNVLKIQLPPLRRRREDIPLLAAWFTRQLSAGKKRLADEALVKLASYAWPGNIRELRNILERALLFSGTDTDTVQAAQIVFDEEKGDE